MTNTLKKAATMAAAATIVAAGFAAHAPAADIRAGLMLKKGFPGAEPVNGMFEGTDQNPVIHLYTHERLRPEAHCARVRDVQ